MITILTLTIQDLIEMLVRLQSTVETQGKKVADLEDYIDGQDISPPDELDLTLFSYLQVTHQSDGDQPSPA